MSKEDFNDTLIQSQSKVSPFSHVLTINNHINDHVDCEALAKVWQQTSQRRLNSKREASEEFVNM